ncbi:hypothetical protein M758_12G095700 [Ceratodon purpureus]|uniref:Uncharacterized protein n=1 Tax=Ceratodon purpureus TaxID=3225 RepID=A0A8T0G594_CERPU|nr:hypothetical protein KC19_12G092300 [Ceratodon purpureus]KAG0598715.1 hypothetical protein M758_12G095700 [Ceratodon purpureus]
MSGCRTWRVGRGSRASYGIFADLLELRSYRVNPAFRWMPCHLKPQRPIDKTLALGTMFHYCTLPRLISIEHRPVSRLGPPRSPSQFNFPRPTSSPPPAQSI